MAPGRAKGAGCGNVRLALLLLSAAAPTIGHTRARLPCAAATPATAPARSAVCAKLSTNPLAYSFGLQEPRIEPPGSPDPDTPPEHFPITREQIDSLTRDGVVHIPGALSPAWLRYMRDATTWQIEHPHMWASPGVASGLYDYIQRNVWSTNGAYARFMYYSPVASILAQLGGADEARANAHRRSASRHRAGRYGARRRLRAR